MKIKYDIKNNYYKIYGEANYLAINKKLYLKNYSGKIRNVSNLLIIISVMIYLMIIVFDFLNITFIFNFLWLIFVVVLYLIFVFLGGLKNFKRENLKGEIIINKDGITDKSSIIVTFTWDKVELIGLTKNALIIITDSPIFLILEPNEKIITEIIKYKDVKIIKNK